MEEFKIPTKLINMC